VDLGRQKNQRSVMMQKPSELEVARLESIRESRAKQNKFQGAIPHFAD